MSSFEGWKGYFCGQMRRLLSTQRDSRRLGLRWLLSGRRFGVTFTMSIVGWTSHKESPSTYGVKFPLATHRIRYRKTIPWWSSQTKAVKSLGSSGDRLPTRQCSTCLNTPTWPLYWEPLRTAYGGQTASKRWGSNSGVFGKNLRSCPTRSRFIQRKVMNGRKLKSTGYVTDSPRDSGTNKTNARDLPEKFGHDSVIHQTIFIVNCSLRKDSTPPKITRGTGNVSFVMNIRLAKVCLQPPSGLSHGNLIPGQHRAVSCNT